MHRTHLILDILMYKMLHIKPLTVQHLHFDNQDYSQLVPASEINGVAAFVVCLFLIQFENKNLLKR